MKQIIFVFLLFISGLSLIGQTTSEAGLGTISYITAQNVYVKFETTENILVGDTLFVVQAGKNIPVLIVKDLSSISCVCTPISSQKLSVADKITTNMKIIQPKATVVPAIAPIIPLTVKSDTVTAKKEMPQELQQNISGRISVSSYSDFSNVTDFSQRFRYTFSMNALNIRNSKLSGETYISFVHKINEWSEIQNNIYNGLKVYSLSLSYAFDKSNIIWVGRKMNPRLSSAGAIDGIQYEHKFKTITTGIYAGTRPDNMDYSFNSKLLQYGGYIGHDYVTSNGNMQTTLAFIEQKNNGNTDRRFAYLQHSNSLLTNLYFFGSVEFDFYNKVMNTQDSTLKQDNTPNLTNLYVSLRYKVIKQLTLSISYSARQNIIYYETYKSIVDQLLEAATLQGYMFQLNCRPVKNLSFGANAGYRFSKQDPRPTKNLYTYLTYSNVPWLNASATASATFLETSYLSGSIYSLGLSRDLIPGKVYGGLGYRYVDYKFQTNEQPLVQNMAELNLTWRMMKKLLFSVNYEGTFEKGRNYDRIYINLTQRF